MDISQFSNFGIAVVTMALLSYLWMRPILSMIKSGFATFTEVAMRQSELFSKQANIIEKMNDQISKLSEQISLNSERIHHIVKDLDEINEFIKEKEGIE